MRLRTTFLAASVAAKRSILKTAKARPSLPPAGQTPGDRNTNTIKN
jgi:hypothetical protein